jgi:2-polyprenyl-6-methoxyphenol hydroxylase-like FAD-dependent oxidoreductase
LSKIYNTIIIGAGPAGLATASSLVNNGDTNFLLLERGNSLATRQRNAELDIAAGIGGAGLFSDGKFSFFPSASMLWSMLDKKVLHTSYNWLTEVLANYDISVPAFNTKVSNINVTANFKSYPSYYLNLAQRYALIQALHRNYTANIHNNTEIINITKIKNNYYLETCNGNFATKHLVIATGRWGHIN